MNMRCGWRASGAAVVGALFAAGCLAPQQKSDSIHIEPPRPAPRPTEREQERRYAAAYQQGLVVAERGNYGVAVGFFEEAAQLRPERVEIRLALGACYEQMGDAMRAIRQYRFVLDVNPNDADAYANMGTAYMKLYQRERNETWLRLAREAWSKSLELRPAQTDVRTYLASLDSAHR